MAEGNVQGNHQQGYSVKFFKCPCQPQTKGEWHHGLARGKWHAKIDATFFVVDKSQLTSFSVRIYQ